MFSLGIIRPIRQPPPFFALHWKLVSSSLVRGFHFSMGSVFSRASSASPSSSAQSLSSSTARRSAQSPSSSTARRWKHDVFLSFRGPDTRKGITSDLYDRLQSRGIKTFMDDSDLEVGNPISPTLLKAIEESRFAIVVLSPNYASSTWCLEELAKICECMEENNTILPLFYNMEPSEVRHQLGSFKEAFDKHESSGRHTSDKVKQWRDALNKVANFSGWDTNNFKTNKELVEKIVDYVCKRIPFDTESTMCTEDFVAYEATRKAMGEVMEALKDDNVTAVGVFGMGGEGKTTMVKYVAEQSKKNGVFHHVIMGVVSHNPDLRLIQGTLAEQLGFKLEDQTEIPRAARLKKEMMKKEKMLIILDDVWDKIELSKIGIPSYKELRRCNSKVVLTTRKKKVKNDMRCERGITLNILSPEDSWSLFERNAGTSFRSFEELARRVAGECGGLPIALKAVARALRDEDRAEWKKAAERLEKSQYANPNHEEDDENAVNCIRLSYDYLKNEDHKSCLLLCCLFPEDHEIEIEELLRYAVRTIFFQYANTIEQARGELVSIVKYLEDSSLLLNSQKKGCVRMHDVIRDSAIQIAESERGFRVKVGFGLKDWPRGLDEGCTAISLMRNEVCKLPEQQLVWPHLQILLLNCNYCLDEIPEKFVESLSELRVLDISDTWISVLPQSFSLLTNLQALYLDDCMKLTDISVVGKLKKLEILSMRSCRPMKLPREIEHLTNLRILDVNRPRGNLAANMITIPFKVISKLHKLEELYMVNCWFEDWDEVEGRGEETSIGLGELAGLSYLKRLQVGIPDVGYIPKNVEAKPDWDYFCISILGTDGSDLSDFAGGYKFGDHNSRYLFLYRANISILPEWFANAMTEKIEKLEYNCIRDMSDILMEYDHGRLHELKYLKVWSTYSDGLKELMNTTGRVQNGPVLEKLEELRLRHLCHLEELCVGELPPGSLFNLKLLTMYNCTKLKNVSKFVQRLPSLEKLHLKHMFELEYVFGCEGSELKESKLREVCLVGPNSVKSICHGPGPRVMFQSIKSLTFYRCQQLPSLFASSDVAQCLSQLEDLYVESCSLFERVIEAVNSEKAVLPKLKNLVLKNLPVLYGASCTVDIECPSLEHLIVVDCPNISFSISWDLFKSSESRNRFSSSASDYFGSTNPVQLNDKQMYYFLYFRKLLQFEL